MAWPPPRNVVPERKLFAWVLFWLVMAGYLAYCILVVLFAVDRRKNPPVSIQYRDEDFQMPNVYLCPPSQLNISEILSECILEGTAFTSPVPEPRFSTTTVQWSGTRDVNFTQSSHVNIALSQIDGNPCFLYELQPLRVKAGTSTGVAFLALSFRVDANGTGREIFYDESRFVLRFDEAPSPQQRSNAGDIGSGTVTPNADAANPGGTSPSFGVGQPLGVIPSGISQTGVIPSGFPVSPKTAPPVSTPNLPPSPPLSVAPAKAPILSTSPPAAPIPPLSAQTFLASAPVLSLPPQTPAPTAPLLTREPTLIPLQAPIPNPPAVSPSNNVPIPQFAQGTPTQGASKVATPSNFPPQVAGSFYVPLNKGSNVILSTRVFQKLKGPQAVSISGQFTASEIRGERAAKTSRFYPNGQTDIILISIFVDSKPIEYIVEKDPVDVLNIVSSWGGFWQLVALLLAILYVSRETDIVVMDIVGWRALGKLFNRRRARKRLDDGINEVELSKKQPLQDLYL